MINVQTEHNYVKDSLLIKIVFFVGSRNIDGWVKWVKIRQAIPTCPLQGDTNVQVRRQIS